MSTSLQSTLQQQIKLAIRFTIKHVHIDGLKPVLDWKSQKTKVWHNKKLEEVLFSCQHYQQFITELLHSKPLNISYILTSWLTKNNLDIISSRTTYLLVNLLDLKISTSNRYYPSTNNNLALKYSTITDYF